MSIYSIFTYDISNIHRYGLFLNSMYTLNTYVSYTNLFCGQDKPFSLQYVVDIFNRPISD